MARNDLPQVTFYWISTNQSDSTTKIYSIINNNSCQSFTVCSVADITLARIQHCRHDYHQHSILDPATSLHCVCTYFVVVVIPHGSSYVSLASSVINFASAVTCGRPLFWHALTPPSSSLARKGSSSID